MQLRQILKEKCFLYIFTFLLSFTALLTLLEGPKSVSAVGPIPSPTPVPCNQTRFPEFHTLRPYQASPCNQGYSQLALFCGDDLFVPDTLTITYQFANDQCKRNYEWPDCFLATPDNISVLPVINNTYTCVPLNGGLQERCTFQIPRTKDIALQLSDAYLPIMGNTELVKNSANPTAPDQLDNATKMNEYVSWYLRGVNNPVEYGALNPSSPADIYKVVNFSGPVNKLTPNRIQRGLAETQVNNAKNTRHDQIVGCLNGSGQITPCYPSSSRQLRLTNWTTRIPPKEENYANFEDWVTAYLEWRGNVCTIVLGVRICIGNPANPSYWSDLFFRIPFTSTEDRKGQVQITTVEGQPLSPDLSLLNVQFLNQHPSDLFFSHMEEDVKGADILQSTFVPKDQNKNAPADPTEAEVNQFCNLTEIRTNPGDNLFPGVLTGTLSYIVQPSCTFYTWGGGNLCRNLENGNCYTNTNSNTVCDSSYSQYDCFSGICGVNCQNYSVIAATPGCSLVDPGGACAPDALSCATSYGQIDCPSGYQCGQNCVGNLHETAGTYTQQCVYNFQIRMSTITKTPLADEAWAKLVAGPAGVFKRIAPKIDQNGPITYLQDIPAMSPVTYTSLNSTVVYPTNGHLYFQHIGSIHQYFLKCIQTILRPQGFGDVCPSAVQQTAPKGTCPSVPDSEVPSKYLGGFKANFISLANRWTADCPGPDNNLADECYNYVVTQSLAAGVNPAFSLTEWLHETDASNYCHSGPTAQDFGVNDASIYQNIVAQLKAFLELPFWGYFTGCSQESIWNGDRMMAFMAIYRTGSCSVNTLGTQYYYEILNQVWGWVTGDCVINNKFAIGWPTDNSCP